MSKLTKALTAAAGNAGGEALYVEDVFSTYLYTGSTSTQNTVNGIDLDGEGGLVWIKNRSNTRRHCLHDTERGGSKQLSSNLTDAEKTLGSSGTLTFNSDGWSVPSGDGDLNGNGFGDYASWTFRKAEKFFDVVTYTGNGASTNDIAHNLGAVPAFVIIKRTDVAQEWVCSHVNLSNLQANYDLHLNDTGTASQQGYASFQWNDTSINVKKVTDTLANANASGGTYVAYLFASDAGGFGDDGSESIIKCGSFTTDSSRNATVNLGYEPQWLLVKRTDGGDDWLLIDTMRGFTSDNNSQALKPNASDSEFNATTFAKLTSTGFDIANFGFTGNSTYIYIAIRRPMKTPESGTEVFSPDFQDVSDPSFTTGFAVDAGLRLYRLGNSINMTSRLTGNGRMQTYSTNAEATGASYVWDFSDGWGSFGVTSTNTVSLSFKRATGFFDVVAYTGTGSARTVSHNLGVAPELMIVKRREAADEWTCYIEDVGATKWMSLNQSASAYTSSSRWNNTAPTSSVFTVGTDTSVNRNTSTYIAYLFATLAGVSKVGSYTGTGSNIDVDCGFSAGARFILIKRTDSTGDWYVWDSVRGIVAGNDPYLLLNSTAAEVTSTDYIDPLASGFTVTSSAPAALNASGGSYIFLAIA